MNLLYYLPKIDNLINQRLKMTQKQFIRKVREITGKSDFNYWHVEHYLKSGLINPKVFGHGIPREFSSKDLDIVKKRLLGE